MWTGLGYAWRVVSNLLQVLIVLYIFSRLDVRFEIIVVAILGLIYVTIRTISLNTAYLLTNIVVFAEKDFVFIRKNLGDDVSAREKEDSVAENKLPQMMFRVAIDGVGLSLIGIVCLYQLFNAL